MINKSNINHAILTGISLVLMAILAGIGYGYYFSEIYAKGDKDATLQNIVVYPNHLFGFVFSFSIVFILDIVVSWSLYQLFRSTNQMLSLIMMMLRLFYTCILGIAIAKVAKILPMVTDASTHIAQIYDGIELFLGMWSLGLIIFGLHLCMLALLLKSSNKFPTYLIVLVGIAGLSYTFHHTLDVFWHGYHVYAQSINNILALPMALGEIILAIWLIVMYKKF